MNNNDYPYLYETHLHTSEASKCSHSNGQEMARAAKKAGYSGIIVTNHNWYGNTCIDTRLPWKEWVELFCQGYENALAEGEKIGLDVFFGYESGYQGTEFLIYGVDKNWLMSHPEIKDASVKEQYSLVHEAGGMVIQAHPFREESYIPEIRLFPEDIDGMETVNATHSCHLSHNHNDHEFDVRALRYAKERSLRMTAGSDVHEVDMLGGGMAFKRKLNSIEDFCQAVLSGEDYLMTDGDRWYYRNGESK